MTPLTISFTVPWPPSVNTYWRHVGPRTLVSVAGRTYRDVVASAIRGSFYGKPEFFQSSLVSLRLNCYPPDQRRRDIDNILKALLDTFTAAGVWDDDYQVAELYVRRCEVRKPGAVEVRIIPICESRGMARD